MRLPTMVLLGAFTFCTSVAAQEKPAQVHQGLWGGFGLGGGVNVSEGDRWGVDVYGRIGGTLSQRVLLGGESSGWAGSHQGVDMARGNLTAIILYYPSLRGGLFLRGGLGFSYIQTSISDGTTVNGVFYQTTVSQTSGGFGATASVGYDVRLGRNIFLVPEFGWALQSVGSESTFFGVPSTVNILSFTLGLVWH